MLVVLYLPQGMICTVVVDEPGDAGGVELCGHVPLHERLLDLQGKVVAVSTGWTPDLDSKLLNTIPYSVLRIRSVLDPDLDAAHLKMLQLKDKFAKFKKWVRDL